MAKLQRVSTFKRPVKFHLPGDGINVWRPFEFTAEFRTLPNDELDALREEQDEKGHIPGLLDRVLVGVHEVEGSEFGDDDKKEDGTPYTPLELAKCNQFSANAATMEFWEAVNRDIKAKNSKTSPKR